MVLNAALTAGLNGLWIKCYVNVFECVKKDTTVLQMKRQTFVAVGDNHGDKVDAEAAAAFFKFVAEYKPQHRIHLGDCFDFRSIRSGASGKEEDESLEEDINAGLDFITRYKPTVFLYGNHEDRLSHIIHASSNGILKDYCRDLDKEIKGVLKENGCKHIYNYHADEGVHRIGPLTFVHGYTCGKDAVEEHAKHYAVSGGALLMGHLHSIQQVNARKHGGAVGFSGGCLCKKGEMLYAKNRLATSKWGTGWLYGYIEGKEWKVWQAHKVGKHFVTSILKPV